VPRQGGTDSGSPVPPSPDAGFTNLVGDQLTGTGELVGSNGRKIGTSSFQNASGQVRVVQETVEQAKVTFSINTVELGQSR
jgi:hypothetical protein